jgi:ABC-2 type transport system permease protein
MSKTFLVARREYFENLRTKTFWIGIAAFPAILLLANVVPIWLEKKKDVRQYAVIDHSGWLLAAVEERADGPDLEKVFRRWLRDYREGKLKLDALPELLRGQIDEIVRGISDQQIEAAASMFASLAGPDAVSGSLPEPMLRKVRQAHEAVRTWWKSLPPAEAAELASDISKSRYQRRELDPAWTDPQAELAKLLANGQVFAYFVIGADPVRSGEGCKYVSNNLTDDSLKDWFASLASDVVRSRRLKEKQIDEVTAAWIRESLDFDEKKVGETGEEEEVKATDTLSQFGPVVFVYVLWIAIFTIAQLLLTNTIEEKSSRVIEVLLSSVSPGQLMRGKILGIAATGLTIVSSWILCFLVAIKCLPLFVNMPNVDLMALVRNPAYLVSFVGYFLLGYLFYAALFVAMGSVCNSLKEAQNLMLPVMVLLMVPLFAMMPVGKDPNGSLARLLSYIPPFTPFIMMNRAAGPPSVTDYVVTTALLVGAVAVAFWSAGRVFRVGILMTGKPPRLKDMLRLTLGLE